MSLFDFRGKCAVVIGGTSGIGKALALGLAKAGADVVASSRSEAGVQAVAAEIRQLGRATLEVGVDVGDRTSINALHEAVQQRFGKVDVLVNSAGVTRRMPTLDWTDESWDKIMDVNLNGTLRACQIFGRAMIAQRAGRIINVASLSTFAALHEVAAYGASKAAVGALTKSLAIEWAPYNVFVNAIAPGVFPTALNSALLDSPRGEELKLRTPMRRFGHADELISAALYLASDASSFTTGQIVVVDGGFLASAVNQ